MKSLFCLCYHQDNELLGVVMVEARTLLEARMFATIDGIDQLAEFSQGFELDKEQASFVRQTSVGRMITPDEARGLMTWIESERNRRHARSALGREDEYVRGPQDAV